MRSRLFLLVLLLAASPLAAQTSVVVLRQLTPGTRVRVDAPGVVRKHFVGSVLLPVSDTLLLADPEGPPVSLRPSQITSLEVSTGRSAIDGAVRGTIAGGALGGVLGAVFARGPEVTCIDCAPRSRRVEDAITMGLVGAGAGFIVGALVGREHWARIALGPGR
jgi:hypothetical protein